MRQHRAMADHERKNEHLALARDARVQRPGRGNGLARYRFENVSLPELDLDRIDTSCVVLGRRLRAPLLVGAMTGGTTRAGQLNRVLAEAAERCGVGLCLGSQRPMLDLEPAVVATFGVRQYAPSVLVMGNIGAIQVRDHLDGKHLEMLAAAVGADGKIGRAHV
mgnify:FL=1